MSDVAGEAELPLLVVAPGMTFAAMKAASTVALDDPGDVDRDWIAQPDGAHRVRLAHETLGFDIPPGLFTVVIADKRGRVTNFRATPQLGYAAFPGACEIVDALDAAMVAAGWEARSRFGPDRLDWALRRDAETVAGVWRPLPDIRKDPGPSALWRVTIRVRKAVEAGTARAAMLKLDGDGFLVTLLCDDGG